MSREALLRQMTAYAFAAFEWNLYLDTHPQDVAAIQRYRQMSQKTDELRTQYEREYGPITASAGVSSNTWDWVNDPWPWE